MSMLLFVLLDCRRDAYGGAAVKLVTGSVAIVRIRKVPVHGGRQSERGVEVLVGRRGWRRRAGGW